MEGKCVSSLSSYYVVYNEMPFGPMNIMCFCLCFFQKCDSLIPNVMSMCSSDSIVNIAIVINGPIFPYYNMYA